MSSIPKNKGIGYVDLPVGEITEENMDDFLNYKSYIYALTEYIERCNTPMTIAIQGGWGSGKTSLMYLIEDSLKKRVKNYYDENINAVDDSKDSWKKHYKFVWFNTWQYSQFSGNNLSLSLFTHFINSLTNNTTFKNSCLKIVKGLAIGSAGILGNAVIGSADAGANAVKTMLSEETNPAENIVKIKENLKVLLSKVGSIEEETHELLAKGDIINLAKHLNIFSKNSDTKQIHDVKVIIFIDDLDRLAPEKAVELLESLKLFFDLKGCVFILACDYQVVVKGVKKKFGSDTNSEMSRSFFDKIIQVPFNVPLPEDTGKIKYMKELVKENEEISGLIEFNEKENDASTLTKSINKKIVELLSACKNGFNPRGIKRLLNSLCLLTKVLRYQNSEAQNNNIYEVNYLEPTKLRILFATLCMQESFPPLYEFLRKTDNLSSLLKNEVQSEEKFAYEVNYSSIINNSGFVETCIKNGLTDDELASYMQRLDLFIDKLVAVVDIDESKTIDDNEVKILESMLRLSNIVSTDQSNNKDEEWLWGQTIRSICRDFAYDLTAEYHILFEDPSTIECIGSFPNGQEKTKKGFTAAFTDTGEPARFLILSTSNNDGLMLKVTQKSIHITLFSGCNRSNDIKRYSTYKNNTNSKTRMDKWKNDHAIKFKELVGSDRLEVLKENFIKALKEYSAPNNNNIEQSFIAQNDIDNIKNQCINLFSSQTNEAFGYREEKEACNWFATLFELNFDNVDNYSENEQIGMQIVFIRTLTKIFFNKELIDLFISVAKEGGHEDLPTSDQVDG